VERTASNKAIAHIHGMNPVDAVRLRIGRGRVSFGEDCPSASRALLPLLHKMFTKSAAAGARGPARWSS